MAKSNAERQALWREKQRAKTAEAFKKQNRDAVKKSREKHSIKTLTKVELAARRRKERVRKANWRNKQTEN